MTLLVFMTSTIGLHLDVHWCKGHLSGIKLISFSQDISQASCCAAKSCSSESPASEEDNDCCNDTEVSAFMDYDASLVAWESDQSEKVTIPEMVSNKANLIYKRLSLYLVVPSDTGPPLTGVQLRVKYQSFLC